MTKEEFNLKEKMKGFGSVPRFDLEDVKEFIEKIKEKQFSMGVTGIGKEVVKVEEIDKLSGGL